MKLQHIYQPVMIKTLLESKDHRASVEDIARQFLINDEPQLQYYKYITRVMPGRVLRSHNVVTSEDDEFVLNIANSRLASEQIQELVRQCTAKIDEYEIKYGRKSIWHIRFAGKRYLRPIDATLSQHHSVILQVQGSKSGSRL